MLARISRNYGKKTAFHCGSASRTWAEMNERSDRLASGLLSQGAERGDSVALFGQDSLEVFEHYFACMKSGLVRVSINWRYAPNELAHILKDCGAKIVLVRAGLEEPLQEALRIAGLAGSCVVVGYGEGHTQEVDYEELVTSAPPLAPMDLDPNDPLVISYTSGTSGVPKGVVHSGRTVAAIIYQGAVSRGLTTDDVWYAPLASSWMACVLSMIGLANGMTTVVMDRRFDIDTFIEEVQRHQVTATLLVPTMIKRLMDRCEGRPEVLSSIRLLAYGSAPITVELVERIKRTLACRMIQSYGLTEGGWVSHLTQRDHDRATESKPELLRSVGRPGGMYEISIRGDDGEELPAGEIGEIWLRGETTMLGYLNLAEATRQVLVDGWLRTHDIGRFDEEGYLFLIDRKDFMIISGAVNIYPSSVESILAEHPDIDEICVVGAPHQEWGEVVVAVVKPHPGRAAPTVAELGAFAKADLSRIELPKHVFSVDELPKTSTGKINKSEVRQFVRVEVETRSWWRAAEADA